MSLCGRSFSSGFVGGLRNRSKCVARAPTAFRAADQYTAFDERQDITQGSILRTLRELRIFRCRELTFEAIEEAVQHKQLALVLGDALDALPETCLGEDTGENGLSAVNG